MVNDNSASSQPWPLPPLAKRTSQLAPSPTLALDSLAKEMKRKGISVVNFGAGEPDFDTPAFIKEAACRALDAGFTKYTAVGGTPELKAAICQKLRQENGLDYSPSQVVVTVGAKHALYELFQVLCEPGDEVILPVPYWVSYEEQIRLAGATPVFLPGLPERGLKIDAAQLRTAISERTRVFLLNSPNNPTGAVYSRAELQQLADVLEGASRCWIVTDEIYESFIYTGEPHVSLPSLSPALARRTIVVNGFSKRYAMTGWRLGYAAGPQAVIQAVTNLQSQSTSNPTSFAQAGGVAALTGSQECVHQMVAQFRKRRDYLVDALRTLPGVACPPPDGAFYAFPQVSAVFGHRWHGHLIDSSAALSRLLLEEAHVAVVPGSAFGADQHLRLSYATDEASLEEGIRRLRRFWQEIE
ncbi:MAG: pyridoxal phosphate-dependent aminotransferase [Limnochordaceae bacterium]|nr:pyridoxal phosphate-dependent aminotransferase [Limnochordaceae bacterium]